MPILKNAKKALRSSNRKAVVNRDIKSRLKTRTDGLLGSPTLDNLKLVFSAIDKAKKRNLIHINKAARLKSQMNKVVLATK